MKIFKYFFGAMLFVTANTFAQNEIKPERKPGHTNQNKFKQVPKKILGGVGGCGRQYVFFVENCLRL